MARDCVSASVGRTEDRRRDSRVAVPAQPRRGRTGTVRPHPAAAARDTHAAREAATARRNSSRRDDPLRPWTGQARVRARAKPARQLVLRRVFRTDAEVCAGKMLPRDVLRQHAVPERDRAFELSRDICSRAEVV